jgi:anti-sigma regulatory factor (Ser/Thr protein kinase)
MKTDSVPTVPNQCVTWETAQTPSPEWPYTSNVELQDAPISLQAARRHARAVALEWGLRPLSDDVELVVSELVTNAIEAGLRTERRVSRAGLVPVRLWLASDLDAILIQVWDSAPGMPVRRAVRLNGERGRGLLLVGCICRAWGTYRQGAGKVVWAVI